MSDSQFAWTWWVQFASATITFLAVLVALFGDPLRRWLFPPRLALSLKPDITRTPVKIGAPDGSVRDTAGRWYHVTVTNSRRWSPANGTEVYLTQVQNQDAAGRFVNSWVGNIPLRWRDGAALGKSALILGPSAEADLCYAIRAVEPERTKWVELCPLMTPSNLPIRYSESFIIIVTLQARSVESDSNVLQVQIAWDGKWSEDDGEMAKHLVVGPVR